MADQGIVRYSELHFPLLRPVIPIIGRHAASCPTSASSRLQAVPDPTIPLPASGRLEGDEQGITKTCVPVSDIFAAVFMFKRIVSHGEKS